MHFCLPNIINAMYIQYLTEVILPHVQNIVRICNHITILILHLVNSKMLTLLKFIYAA